MHFTVLICKKFQLKIYFILFENSLCQGVNLLFVPKLELNAVSSASIRVLHEIRNFSTPIIIYLTFENKVDLNIDSFITISQKYRLRK